MIYAISFRWRRLGTGAAPLCAGCAGRRYPPIWETGPLLPRSLHRTIRQDSGEDLPLQRGQACGDGRFQCAQGLLMDHNVFGVAGCGRLQVCQEEGRFQGNIVVEGGVLPPRGGPDGGDDPPADAHLGIGGKPGAPVRPELPDRGQQAQHPLLDQVLAVAPRQKNGRAHIRTRRVCRRTNASSAPRSPAATRAQSCSSVVRWYSVSTGFILSTILLLIL